MKITEIINKIELHDSVLNSVIIDMNGVVELSIDLDEVWNRNTDVRGFIFYSVYEISEFKIDRLNIIGGIEWVKLDKYDDDFVTQRNKNTNKTIMLSVDFVAGGSLMLICEDSGNYLRRKA